LFSRAFKEPLLHFLLLALLIFGVHWAGGSHEAGGQTIRVTASKVAQLIEVYSKTWQRAPTELQLTGLIDDYVKEEIYVREAVALGLDKDDSVIRRRLRLKMEFMNDAAVDAMAPTDAELESYLSAHPQLFADEPMLALQQILFRPEKHGDGTMSDAVAALGRLNAGDASAESQGDSSLLPAALPMTPKTSIAEIYGSAFADALDKLPVGTWAGPVSSTYGIHLVKVINRSASRLPPLSEVREVVLREWSNDKRTQVEDARFKGLLKKYHVTVDTPQAASASN
jgi:hypothetical protein